MSGTEITPGGNPTCSKCGRWYGFWVDHVCDLEDLLAARVAFYEGEYLSDESPVTKARAAEAQAILSLVREQKNNVKVPTLTTEQEEELMSLPHDEIPVFKRIEGVPDLEEEE